MNPSFWQGRRVFVTGHAGFKGSWLCLWLLDAGARVLGYSNRVPTRPSLFELARLDAAIEWIVGDVRDHDHLRRSLERFRPDVVFHLAAQPLLHVSFQDPLLTYSTNVIGTVNLLEAVRVAEQVRVVVVVTSDKVYGDGAAAFTEDDPLGGSDPYSSSKSCAELVTAAYRASFFGRTENAAVATARAGNVIGGGDWARGRLVPDVMATLLDGRPLEVRHPHAIRPWQHVLDSLDGYLVLAEQLWQDRRLAGPWNFAPEPADMLPVGQVVERLATLWGTPIAVLAPSSAYPPEAPTLRLDARRARESLGWRPGWNLDQALESIVEWYRAFAARETIADVTLAQIRAYQGDQDRLPVPT
jgi:CDP-glucose 4,6-dehydratase